MLEKAEFDYLVLGGGTAGAVVAARLAEDPETSVCLVEAGPSDEGEPGLGDLAGGLASPRTEGEILVFGDLPEVFDDLAPGWLGRGEQFHPQSERSVP